MPVMFFATSFLGYGGVYCGTSVAATAVKHRLYGEAVFGAFVALYSLAFYALIWEMTIRDCVLSLKTMGLVCGVEQ